MKNITLSADAKLIERAELRARQRKTSLNAAFRDWLTRYAGSDAAEDEYRRLMKQLDEVDAGRRFRRDQMNSR